jgi:hypothetical protein
MCESGEQVCAKEREDTMQVTHLIMACSPFSQQLTHLVKKTLTPLKDPSSQYRHIDHEILTGVFVGRSHIQIIASTYLPYSLEQDSSFLEPRFLMC